MWIEWRVLRIDQGCITNRAEDCQTTAKTCGLWCLDSFDIIIVDLPEVAPSTMSIGATVVLQPLDVKICRQKKLASVAQIPGSSDFSMDK